MYSDVFDSPIVFIPSDYATVKQGDTVPRSVGFVCDEAVKRIFAAESVKVPGRYDPFDVETKQEFLEVKSSNKWVGPNCQVFVSGRELQHARMQYEKNGKDTCYLFFDATEGGQSVEDLTCMSFIGGARYSELKKKFTESPYPAYDGTPNYQFLQKYLYDV